MNRMNPIDMMMIIDVEYKNTHIYMNTSNQCYKYENEVSEQTFKIDQQIKEYQRRIHQCSNYLDNIDAHCR